MGYWNAMEAELKQFLYKDYLFFVAEIFNERYGEEARGQKNVLNSIADISRNKIRHQMWVQFVRSRFPQHSEFLLDELPQSSAMLAELRNPSAHGSMQERKKAERAREIVLGVSGKPGLVERLVALRQSSGSGEAV
jgi:hypothetical protein